MGNENKVILIMIDGLGMPEEGWNNSILSSFCLPQFIELLKEFSFGVDACLGVEGLPQSATGQTSMFTGVNAAMLMGKHLAAFPGKKLKELISEKNILRKLKTLGLKPVFANAYASTTLESIYNSRYCSVTTAMIYSIQKETFSGEDLINGRCVYHDITNETLNKKLNIPIISPVKAASNLLNLSRRYDFTLFEYFLTDRAGHKKDMPFLKKVLFQLSEFILELYKNLPNDTIVILCSDHGNCEDVNTKIHTLNPVPLVVLGLEKKVKSNIKSIVDIYDFILSIYESAQ
jgi:2,3-bisphosphoglycerate-independent phosphoglycerate mutase